MKYAFICLIYYFVIHIGKKHGNILFIFIVYILKNFVIIKKGEIIDLIIDFDDSKILRDYGTNHIFQRWM